MSVSQGSGKKVILRNSRARHDYFVEETIEAGLVLVGSEVKSLRAGKASIAEAYAQAKDGEAFLYDMQVNEWTFANRFNHAPRRDRKLLLHKAEIKKLDEATRQKGYTLLPLEVYLSGGNIKVLLGLCKGKKQYDKREDQKEKDAKFDMKRAMGR
ncbi:MAG TPA: SsrA-binding protein SmpB [Pseudomonadota bacterium]|jgi:SsrA-binding protein|nr:SsrA-binding protein SmpB [Pseudomonadota bacterium]